MLLKVMVLILKTGTDEWTMSEGDLSWKPEVTSRQLDEDH